ncbi:MAG: hypothetical protein ATN31_07310 [Candidatus Epulonipiscioides saccharophilum]|nr:MAG: hypothetical protein ATN31_07310 [Epulopiscium sp. AS2M-Bin001]
MISFRKQIFGLFIGLGLFIVVLVSSFINNTMMKDFQDYIESNVKLVSYIIANEIASDYNGEQLEVNGTRSEILAQLHLRRYAISILDADKNILFGVNQEILNDIIVNDERDGFVIDTNQLDKMVYQETDLPVKDNGGTIIAYIRLGYYPSLILATDDIIFQQQINRSILIVASITIVIAIIVSMYLTQLISKPIYEISQTSVSLIKGDYTARNRKASHIKELELLRMNINNLAQRLQEEDELRRKLVSDISHEIRTPLHILQSNLEAIIDGIYPVDDEQMNFLYNEVVRFGNLLKNLDKLKDVEEHKKELSINPHKINQYLEEIFNNFKIVAIEKGLVYQLSIDKTRDVCVNIDVDAFKQIMMNILSNAFKFTECGRIDITTIIKSKRIVIIVRDTGIGIGDKDKHYIFDRMYRADKSREKYEGSGIGLSIVQNLILKLDGEICVKSAEGIGTTMLIYLPIVK